MTKINFLCCLKIAIMFQKIISNWLQLSLLRFKSTIQEKILSHNFLVKHQKHMVILFSVENHINKQQLACYISILTACYVPPQIYKRKKIKEKLEDLSKSLIFRAWQSTMQVLHTCSGHQNQVQKWTFPDNGVITSFISFSPWQLLACEVKLRD